MTLLAGCIGTGLCLLLATFVVDVAGASESRMRAQIAADAAALAAVAESAPHGAGDPRVVAAEYAAANGGRLVSCLCEWGGTAVQVEVVVQGAAARARAVFDPEYLFPLSAPDTNGLHPVLSAAVAELLAAGRGAIRLVSSLRSTAEQRVLWERALARYGSAEVADDWVAPPGSSFHERGLAVDLGGDLALARRLVRELDLPLHQPLAHEPGHYELAGSRG